MQFPTYEEILETARAFRIVRGVPSDILDVQCLNRYATLPTYGSNGAAGLDLCANFFSERGHAPEPHGHGLFTVDDYFDLAPGQRHLFKTGLAVAIPPSHYGRIAPRSGLAYKAGIDVMAGVIDEDYRGDVGVILINLGSEPYRVKHGDRIAQLIIEKYTPVLVVPTASLDDTNRGASGWGSTGK
jgi:dUTP pyrophosphatase